MRARGLVDVLIPRGGAGLIRSVVEESTVPVIETGVGNCHVYVDARRRPRHGRGDRAQRQDPAAVGVQRRRVAAGARGRRRRVRAAGRRRRCRRPASRCTATTTFAAVRRACVPATEEDHGDRVPLARHRPRPSYPTWTRRSRTSARYSSGHTEAIVTDSQAAARRFTAAVDSAAVHGQRLDPVHRRRRVRLRRRDRHLHPEAARPRADGAARDDLDEVRRHRRRPLRCRYRCPAPIGVEERRARLARRHRLLPEHAHRRRRRDRRRRWSRCTPPTRSPSTSPRWLRMRAPVAWRPSSGRCTSTAASSGTTRCAARCGWPRPDVVRLMHAAATRRLVGPEHRRTAQAAGRERHRGPGRRGWPTPVTRCSPRCTSTAR